MDFEWTLIDTETTGLKAPIYAVEVAAQRMLGWKTVGSPFRAFLNHEVDIPPEAENIHGYRREFLAREGVEPHKAHCDFNKYAGSTPLISYNLYYDYDSVLRPEWQRLRHRERQTRGFCALALARKLIEPDEVENFKLQTLREHFKLPHRGAHSASGDVRTVIDLLSAVIQPLVRKRGLSSFEDVQDFAIRGPYLERLPFGKHKGRSFRDGEIDARVRGWLEWLSGRPDPESANMGIWYLENLDRCAPKQRRSRKQACSSPFNSSEPIHSHTSPHPTMYLPSRRGGDIATSIAIPLEAAASGCWVQVQLTPNRTHEVKVPSGVREGQILKLSGLGHAGLGGGEAGDAVVEVRFAPHSVFRLSGRDLGAELPLTPDEAENGSKVVTLSLGGKIELCVPPGSSDGRVLRLRGKGLPSPNKNPGDLYLTVKIVCSASLERKVTNRYYGAI